VTILNADILQVPAVELLAGTGREAAYTVTGNLPYYIGTAVIRHFLYSDRPPAAMVVMLQEEVAQGVVAGTGHRNYLSVMVQAIADARILFSLPPSAFRPAPRVRSAVVRLETRKEPLVARERIADFLEFAQAGFRAPRKTLRNSLVVGLQAEAAAVDDLLGRTGVDSKQRPAFVELEEWVRLFEAWSSGR
jgi:16S rRNA (adenine1518-N6/adenine1519-N6)-dimethyltransferase